MTLALAHTITAARRRLAEQFANAGIESAETDARLLMAYALGIDRAALIANGERKLAVAEAAAIAALAERRLAHEPIARILGRKEFWTLSLTVTPDVLVPRPETETLVEAALAIAARETELRLLDIGTGTGALLLALLSELLQATGIGTDINPRAVDVARDNAARNGLDARATFIVCDIAAGVEGPFDLVVSNPPYIARGDIATLAADVRDYDPALALDGGGDGLAVYRAIAADAHRLLKPGGYLIVELGAGQEQDVRALFTDVRLETCAVHADLAGIPRALIARTTQ